MVMIDSESAAIDHATQYLQSLGVSYARCLGAVRLPKHQTGLWRSVIRDQFADGTWLWQVNFEKRILPPNKVITHNEFSVFIDSQTATCGIFN